MSPPPSTLSALSLCCLPALSVVLGMPLCRNGHSDITAGRSDSEDADLCGSSTSCSPAESGEVSTSAQSKLPRIRTSSARQRKYQDEHARRIKDNVSRIYARRVIDRARLEREHPWAFAAANPASDSPMSCEGEDEIGDDIPNIKGNVQNCHSQNGGKSLKTKGSDEKKSQKSSWKDELLSETLLSLIKLQDKLDKIKSLTDGTRMESITARNDGLLNTLFNTNIESNDRTNLLKRLGITDENNLFLPVMNNNLNVANCESSKQRTLNQYNDLASSQNNNNADKPAEWSDDIDLVKKRLEFGREISPLSDTSMLERWRMAFGRMATLGALVAPLGVMVPLNVVLGNFAGRPKKHAAPETIAGGGKEGQESLDEASHKHQTRLQRHHQNLTKLTWDYALWAIETAGPTYIKLVQWASTRNDLFSPEFVGHFSKLQDETRGHTWKETEKSLVKAYGKDWRRVLSFDKVVEDVDGEDDDEGLKRRGGKANQERQKRLLAQNERQKVGASSASVPTVPIGSGCVAQVYKARLTTSHGLHPPGTSVAVKVQHPRILEKVCLDFYIFNKVASLLECIPYLNLDYLSMKDSVDQFRDIMLPQLDLRVEAHNLKRFRRDFEGENQIAFPEPIVGLTSREVLVERFVEGEPMLNYVLREDELHSRKDREELAKIGLDTVMKMIFLHDFIHADLHPGNMIVDHNKNVRGSPIRVNMIDCGLTVELGERDHMNLVRILGSLIKKDGYSAGELMVDTAKKCQATELDVEMFCKGIEKICVDDEENNFLESVGDYITDICFLACKHKVKLEAAFINAALACEIMEGLASSLYPEMEVQKFALPLVLKAEMMHGMKGLPNPRTWSFGK